jgi:aldehyde:ferredoxin oxidoreductase
LPIPDDGPVKGSRVTQKELDLLLDDYYLSRGWTKQGIPTEKKLQNLNMENFLLLIEKKVGA